MEQKKSLLSKTLLSVVLPVGVIFFMMAGAVLFLVDQDIGATARNDLLLILGIGLIVTLGIIILGIKGTSNKITELLSSANRLAMGDSEGGFNTSISHDQLGDLSIAFVNISENIRACTTAARNLANGDTAIEIKPKSEKDLLGTSLENIRNSVARIAGDTEILSALTKKGNFTARDDAKGLSGDYKTAIHNVNQTMDTIVEKMDWYEAILDALPNPIQVMDNDIKWVFINKTLEGILSSTGLIKDRESVYGTKSCEANLEVCYTEGCLESCGIRRLTKEGLSESQFEYDGKHNRKDTVYLKNTKGENIGFVEMSSDLTSVKSVSIYTEKELQRLGNNLLKLSDGNLDFDMDIAEGNEFTSEVCEQFKEIEKSLGEVKHSIGNLIDDSTLLVTAAIEGKLEERANESVFKGSWRELIGGMNNILEEIEKPFKEVVTVMNEMSSGILNVEISGSYKGSFDELKRATNTTASRLNGVVSEISNITKQIGDGNLNIKKVRDYQGDFNEISNAFNTIIESLNALLGNINDASMQVSAGSNQVADGSQSLAQGSTEQASSIQELTAAIAEIADQTKNNAANANKARELTTDVRGSAAKGNEQMSEMQGAMVEINQSSKDISKIIKVIDDIAFQTNILALNAAVEAARAGQHGKGFAVVAEEVRTLAARSSDAAKETTLLIEGSISKVQEGTKIADVTAEALDDIVKGIAVVTDLIGNIAKASNEQATGIAQINSGVDQVAQVVQQNSATAEQSAAASEELSSQAELLKEAINQFQLRKR